MIGNSFTRLPGSKRNLLALMASSVVFTAGCANMATTATTADSLGSAAALSGKIHGGNQPVIGAVVNLYYAGQAPTPASLAATTTTDAAGSFNFVKDPVDGHANNGTTNTFSCPSNRAFVYVVARGGNTQNNGDPTQSNSAAAFIAAYGICTTLTGANFVDMTEVTTVATMAAFQQFFDPTKNANGIFDSLIADGTGQQFNIIANVPNTIALLADLSAGTAAGSTTLNAAAAGNINPSVSVTATPEPGKVNLLANILSACINSANSSASACTSLFSAAQPPNSSFTNNFNKGALPAATDTLQAIYYMLDNPANSAANQATLFGLAGGVSGPYQPALATQPTDWTIAVNFASSSTCGTSTGGNGGFISGPIDINIDSFDNVWIANSQATIGNLSEISSGGIPTTCVLVGNGGSQGGATVDSAGNIWTGSGTSLYRYTPGTKATLQFPTTVSPIGVTADGLGNVYFTAVKSNVGSLYEIPGAASLSVTAPITPLQISNAVGVEPVRLMPDNQGKTTQSNIFVTSGSTFVSEVSPGTGTGSLNGFVTTQLPTAGSSYGVTLGPANQLFVSANDSGAISGFSLQAGVYNPISGFPYTTPGDIGIATPTSISVDGRLNVWIPNHTNGSGTGSVSELASQGAATGLSPSTGFQKDASFLNSSRASVVDQAGNVWVAGDGANFITEIVGAGVPIFQPYAIGLQAGRFQSIP